MSSSHSDRIARQPAHRSAGASALAAGALLVSLAFSAPATAQWIGTPGGSGSTDSTVATPPAAAPVTPPASSFPSTVAPSAAPGFTPAPGMQPGIGMGGASSSMDPGFGMMPGMSAPGPSAADAAAAKECQTQVDRLRGDVEARGGALQKATKTKIPPSELCPMFREFVSTQQKFISYLSANRTKCHVPEEALAELKKNATGVSSVRDKVCQVAKLESQGGPSGPPPQGSISAGLGLSSGLPSGASEKGGVFDTLGGDALR
ncbi:hypothetical protein [Ancylobacter pratisalsi]|uniref:Uncharacterized protein n=1 Tax=Ancylobacter pratisalsi TaxID=1745854 RepID=A0A6P1YNA1_9HYPH|nr:hypothetical protein [Ancylobacter pratisalsi]QIB34191.1 hypothetical protein G3A50_11100 [Ancylobacter pratisalsi]